MPFAVCCYYYWVFADLNGHFYYLFRFVDSIISIWIIHQVIHSGPNWVKRNILESPALIRIGQISYGLYVMHYPLPIVYAMLVSKVFDHHPQLLAFFSNFNLAWFLNLVLLFVLSFISYRYFEKPVMKMKRYFEY